MAPAVASSWLDKIDSAFDSIDQNLAPPDDSTNSSNGNRWGQIPGQLKQVSAGSDGTVWGVNASGNIYKLNGNRWIKIPGQLNQISVGSSRNVWGVNANGNIFQRTGNRWALISGQLKQVSVGSDGTVWGVNASGNIYQRNGNKWVKISGALNQISVGSSGNVWGVNASGNIYQRIGNTWVNIPGGLKQVSVGSDGTIWGLNASGNIYKYKGYQWVKIPGQFNQISVGSNGTIWGVNARGNIYSNDNRQARSKRPQKPTWAKPKPQHRPFRQPATISNAWNQNYNPPATFRVTTGVNYRSCAGKNCRRLGTVRKGTIMTVYRMVNGWYEVGFFNGGKGYIYKDYLTRVADNSRSPQWNPPDSHRQAPRPAYQQHDNSYIAIAFSESTGASNTIWGEGNSADADYQAVRGCNQTSNGRNDCEVVVSGKQVCASLVAIQRSVNNYPYWTNKGRSRSVVESHALNDCRSGMGGNNCQLLSTQCSWDPHQ